MGAIDIIILICFLPAIYQGLTKGFISQAISLLAIFAGAWLAFRFSEVTCTWLAQYLTGVPDSILHALGFLIIFIFVAIILNLLARLLENILKFAMLGWVNKLLGIALALAKSALVIGLLAIVFATLNAKFNWFTAEDLDNSLFFNPLKDTAYKIFPYLKSLLFK